jgi:hypothetical protein
VNAAPDAVTDWSPGQPSTGEAWVYETSRFSTCGYDFSIRVMDVELGRFLDDAWAPTAVPGEATHRYSLIDRGAGVRRGRFSLYWDDELVVTTGRPSRALGMLSWHVNRQVVGNRGDRLVLHAAGAEHRGRALVIPGVMEAGKTTLVAGLTRRGLRYLTDEAVFIDPVTTCVRPYPKPLSIDPGSWTVLSSLRPIVPPALAPFLCEQWQVPATSIRDDAVGPPCRPAWIVATSYDAARPTTLTELSASDAVVTLAESTFDFDAAPTRHLEAIAAVVRGCRRYRLVVSDLDRACDLVLELLEEN